MRREFLFVSALATACATDSNLDLDGQSAALHQGTTIWSRQLDMGPFGRHALTTDANGNAVFFMHVSDGLDPQSTDIRVAKLSATGGVLWDRVFRSKNFETAAAIATDAERNIVLVGHSAVSFRCATIVDGASAYVVKLDPAGQCLWVRPLHDIGMGFYDVAIDQATGEIVAVGRKRGVLDLGNGVVLPDDDPQRDERFIFVARFAPDGRALWARQYGGYTRDGGSSGNLQEFADVEVAPGGDVLLTGHFHETIDFGGGPLTAEIPSGGNVGTTMFLARLDPSGQHVFSRAFGSVARPGVMRVGPTGEIAVGGVFLRTIDFGSTQVSTAFETLDLFVVKFRADGSDMWSKHLWGGASMGMSGIGLDSQGGVIIYGWFREGGFHLGSHHWEVAPDDIRPDLFLARLGAETGGTVWARRWGDTDEHPYLDAGGLAITANDRILIGGLFTRTLDLGDGAMTGPADDTFDGFIARLYR